ncbi:MAG TPA: GAF domain-containing sensor histidine kinase [Candidatus Binatia bacterium]|nr:GAF domain-containing sensor histidine kinase [Candidatus Binatia bacterium]
MLRGRHVPYALAPLLAAAAVLATAVLPDLADRPLFVLPFAATVVAAWLGGLGPAVLALAVAVAVLGGRVWDAPFRFVVFMVLGVGAGIAGELQRRRREERERLHAAAEAAERRFAFLAEASATLTASLDYDVTLATVARQAVPFLADWCTVDLLEAAGGARRVALAYGCPTKTDLARAAEVYPPDPEARHPRTRVLRTGRSELFPDVDEAGLARIAAHPEQLRVMRAVGYKSAMIVALVAHGQTLGAMTFAITESARQYGAADLAVAEDLASRAALAIDNARLFSAAEAARADAEAASRAKDDFLAVVSHELRTPLTAAFIWTRLLSRESFAPERVAQAAGMIERSMKRQIRLVEQILDMSRVVTGALRLDRRPIDLRDAIATAVESVRPAAETKGVTLEVVGMDDARVIGDPTRLVQVFENLLQNGVEYTAAGGRVAVGVEDAGSSVRVRVSDTGEGIAADLLPHVFDRFRQADSTSTRRHGGLGLGLSLVRELVALHDGTVRVESAGHGRGATFVVELPAAIEEAAAG